MAKKKTEAVRWKVLTGIPLGALEHTLEKWTGDGWTAFTILGPYGSGHAIVLSRLSTL